MPGVEQKFNVMSGRFGGVVGGFRVYSCGCISNNRGIRAQCEEHYHEYLSTGFLKNGHGDATSTLDSYNFVCPFDDHEKSRSAEWMTMHLRVAHGVLDHVAVFEAKKASMVKVRSHFGFAEGGQETHAFVFNPMSNKQVAICGAGLKLWNSMSFRIEIPKAGDFADVTVEGKPLCGKCGESLRTMVVAA